VEDIALGEVRRIRLVVEEGIVHLGDILVVAESYLSMEAWVEGLVHIDSVVVLDHNLAADEAVPIGLVVVVLHSLPVAVVRHRLPVVVDNLPLVVRHTLAEMVGTLEEGGRLVVDSLLEADLDYIDQVEDQAEDRNLAGESLKVR
jgi:hypothetical protein